MSSLHTGCDTTHSVADLSAIHRDLLWMPAQTGSCESRQLQRALSNYYTESNAHSEVCDVLEELIERDFLTTNDTAAYQITEAARRVLSARHAWQAGTPTTSDGGHK